MVFMFIPIVITYRHHHIRSYFGSSDSYTHTSFSLLIPFAIKMVMQIFVKTATGKTITLDVEDSDTIASVKAKIDEDNAGIGARGMELRGFGFKLLEDDRTLSDYGIENEDWVSLEMKLPPPLPESRARARAVSRSRSPVPPIWDEDEGEDEDE